jgi:hypothetical protein
VTRWRMKFGAVPHYGARAETQRPSGCDPHLAHDLKIAPGADVGRLHDEAVACLLGTRAKEIVRVCGFVLRAAVLPVSCSVRTTASRAVDLHRIRTKTHPLPSLFCAGT